jgi:hypothetical protein
LNQVNMCGADLLCVSVSRFIALWNSNVDW